MKALPKRFSGDWVKAECDREYELEKDEDGKIKRDDMRRPIKKLDEDGEPTLLKDTDVEYKIEPINNRIRTHIASKSIGDDNEPDLGGAAILGMSFALKGLKGVDDPETGAEMVLEFINAKIGKKTFKRVIDDQLERLPPILFDEISVAAGRASKMDDEEEENLSFT